MVFAEKKTAKDPRMTDIHAYVMNVEKVVIMLITWEIPQGSNRSDILEKVRLIHVKIESRKMLLD